MYVDIKKYQASNRKCKYLSPIVLVLALAGVVNTAQAQTVYSTSFERSKFLGGEQLLGVDKWSEAIPPFLNAPAAKITGDASRSGEQSIIVRGEDLYTSAGITAPYDAVGSYRRPLDFTITAENPKIRVEADVLISTNRPKTDDQFFSLTISARSGNGEILGEVGISSAGKAEGFALGQNPGDPAAQVKDGIALNRWHHLTMILDTVNDTTQYFIDGHALGVALSAPSSSNILLRSAMGVFARPDDDTDVTGSHARSNYAARFDNFRVSADN
ncbi:MAG: hypothetical protein IPN42_13995 [Methylococcaceae bacterium]|nr:hypothetical protein [Methylococcaceae bacterium]